MVRLAIDFENGVQRWWDGGGRELWDQIREGFDDSEVLVEESIAHSWIAEAERIPGWHAGPDYAPHPVIVKPVDDDEEL